MRIGALRMRLLTTADRINEYLAGKVASIPELEEEQLPFPKHFDGQIYAYPKGGYRRMTTACIY